VDAKTTTITETTGVSTTAGMNKINKPDTKSAQEYYSLVCLDHNGIWQGFYGLYRTRQALYDYLEESKKSFWIQVNNLYHSSDHKDIIFCDPMPTLVDPCVYGVCFPVGDLQKVDDAWWGPLHYTEGHTCVQHYPDPTHDRLLKAAIHRCDSLFVKHHL
jgi:hypothetical protein